MSVSAFVQKIFDFYIHASLHVALATTALVQMTFYFSAIPFDAVMVCFVFCGTCASYNIIKYLPYALRRQPIKNTLKLIFLLTFLCLVICAFLFFRLTPATQWATCFLGLLSVLYVMPLSKKTPNLRNLAGVKIYIVSICWAGVTLILPLLNAGFSLGGDVVYKFLQRFILTLVLLLIFEIYDLKHDERSLKTVPQTFGVRQTKLFIYVLLVPFYFLEFLKSGYYANQWKVNLILVLVIALFTYFDTSKRSKYYTLFWVESIPVLWFVLILWLG